jgi:ArsR family transcriptional regulator, lead/cadmium/zinc/bismuth-responsive transcriptional repressor
MAPRNKPPLSAPQVNLAAQLFRLLGDPARLRILLALGDRGEARAGDLTAAAGLSRTATAHHLMVLRMGGLVEGRRAGKRVFYRVASPLALKLLRALEEG